MQNKLQTLALKLANYFPHLKNITNNNVQTPKTSIKQSYMLPQTDAIVDMDDEE